ncbi:hypothetical protein GCM10022254_29210 [Actinomadura meridiana]|uniref:Uncharacterized protein n=1 Tax=Actinomadura meridiana TaxID=559626 RepID=A0ABP8C0T9_9ACTN
MERALRAERGYPARRVPATERWRSEETRAAQPGGSGGRPPKDNVGRITRLIGTGKEKSTFPLRWH